MPASAHLDRGQGPVVVLVHGVGVGPESFTDVVEHLVDNHRVVVVERPGGGGGPAVPLAEQAGQLVDLLVEVDAVDGTLVGVSGGATLGLLLMIDHPGAVRRALLHEPLVGHHAALLHRQFRRAAGLAAGSDLGAMEVVRSVMGDAAWARLGPDGQAASWAQVDRWRDEIALFAAFDPSVADLVGVDGHSVLVTVGDHSGPERRTAAEALRRISGATVVGLPGSGNAAQLDAPEALAHVIRSWQTVPVGDQP